MSRSVATIKARFKNGIIEPLEKLELEEGEEITLNIIRLSNTDKDEDAFERSRGSWRGLIDCEELKKDIYESRLINTRPEVKL